jgi:hypothetical protein
MVIHILSGIVENAFVSGGYLLALYPDCDLLDCD